MYSDAFKANISENIYQAGEEYLQRHKKSQHAYTARLVWDYCYLTGASLTDILRYPPQISWYRKGVESAYMNVRMAEGRDITLPILNEWEGLMWSKMLNFRYERVSTLDIRYGRTPASYYNKLMREIATILLKKDNAQKPPQETTRLLRPLRAYVLLDSGLSMDYIQALFNTKSNGFLGNKNYNFIGAINVDIEKLASTATTLRMTQLLNL